MKNNRYSGSVRTVTSVLIYLGCVIALFAPLIFVDADLGQISYPPNKGQTFFMFNGGFYFEPFIELIFISSVAILIGFIVFGAAKVKMRATLMLVLAGCVYVPLSLFIDLLPSFFDYISDSIQVLIRSAICKRHHTEIVGTRPGYLYDCPLGVYAGFFIIIKNFFVLINLTILSAISGFIFMCLAAAFQDNAKYLSFQGYIYFCLPIFAGSLPLVGVMAVGQLFDLYEYVLYQGCILFVILISFIPIIAHVCNETNTTEMVPLSIRKTYCLIGVIIMSVVAAGCIWLSVFVFDYDMFYLFLLHSNVGYYLMFASFFLFFVVLLALQSMSFTDDGIVMGDLSLVILTASVFGALLVALLSDSVAMQNYVWHVQDNLISRHIFDGCVLSTRSNFCPYF